MRTWFQTFVGITALICFVVMIIEASLSPHQTNTNAGFFSIATSTLQDMGAKDTSKIVHDFQIWRLASCIFLHASWMHLFMNMFVQMTFCFLVETGIQVNGPQFDEINPHKDERFRELKMYPYWGPWKTALIYLCAGIGGSLLGSVCNPDTMCVGASGAIMGILGSKTTVLILYLTSGTDQLDQAQQFQDASRKREACMMAIWIILIFSFGIGNPLIDNWGHLGGLFLGMLMGGALFSDEVIVELNREVTGVKKHVSKICIATVVIIFVLLITLLCTVVNVR